MTNFKKATRQHAFLKLALTGPSGSGKTWSALQLAFGLGERIALIDTENGSASLYAHLGCFDTLELTPPFTVRKYLDAINDAVSSGYDVLIIDSLSHAWAGDGGLLAQKESLDSRGGNSFTNWASISKQHELLKSAILQAPIHTIATMRSKQDYILTTGTDGKAVPQKVGLAPVQRDGIEYEFTVVLDIAMNHEAVAAKDRTGLFEAMGTCITPQHGSRLKDWLNTSSIPLISSPLGVNTAPAIELSVKRIVDREVDGVVKNFIITADAVYQTEGMKEEEKLEIMKRGCVSVWSKATGATIKVGNKSLPLNMIDKWQLTPEAVTLNNGKVEVLSDGR